MPDRRVCPEVRTHSSGGQGNTSPNAKSGRRPFGCPGSSQGSHPGSAGRPERNGQTVGHQTIISGTSRGQPSPQPKARKQAAVPKQVVAAVKPGPAPQAVYLTAVERVDTAIEVRNGTWTKNLAHETRSLLRQEGFTVAKIGNHIDFGATKTMIYYRPGAEKVARAVGHTLFPGAELAPSLKLTKGTDIKVLLGSDLLENPPFMARLHHDAPPAAPAAKKSPAIDKPLAAKTEAKQPAIAHQEPRKEPVKGRAGATALAAQGQSRARPSPSALQGPPP